MHLGDALRHGDRIHAIVRASGVNQDGRTDGISLPNSRAQEEPVRSVYEKTGIPLDEVDSIEAHGTGTQAGDPAEVKALDAVFRPYRNLNSSSAGSNPTLVISNLPPEWPACSR